MNKYIIGLLAFIVVGCSESRGTVFEIGKCYGDTYGSEALKIIERRYYGYVGVLPYGSKRYIPVASDGSMRHSYVQVDCSFFFGPDSE